MIELNRAACEFLTLKHGLKHRAEERKLLADDINAIFPRIEAEKILKKITDKLKNERRIPKATKACDQTQLRKKNDTISSNRKIDYDELLQSHNIGATVKGNDDCSEEYLDDEEIYYHTE